MSNVNFYRTMYRPMVTGLPPEPTGETESRLVYNIRSQQLTGYSSGSVTYDVYGYNGLAASTFTGQPVVGGFINNQQADHVVNTGTAKLHSIFYYEKTGLSSASDLFVVSFSSSDGTNNPPVHWDKIIFKFLTGSNAWVYDRKDATDIRITTAGSSTIYSFYFDMGNGPAQNPIYWDNNNLAEDSSDTISSQFGIISYSASNETHAVMGLQNSAGCDAAFGLGGFMTYWFSGSSPSIAENLDSLKGLYVDRNKVKEAPAGNYKFYDGTYYTASINTASAPYHLGPMVGGTYSTSNHNFSSADYCAITGSMTIANITGIAGNPKGWYAFNNSEEGSMTSNYSKIYKELNLTLIAPSVTLRSFYYYTPLNEVWLGFRFFYNTGGVFPRYHGMTNFKNVKTLYLDNGTINGYLDLQDPSKIRGWGYSTVSGVFVRYGIESTPTKVNPNWPEEGPYIIDNPDYNPIAAILASGAGTTVNYSLNNIYPLLP